MDSDVFTDQGNFPTHGIRDVSRKADTEQHDWSELAEAPIIKQLTSLLLTARNSYTLIIQGKIQTENSLIT